MELFVKVFTLNLKVFFPDLITDIIIIVKVYFLFKYWLF